ARGSADGGRWPRCSPSVPTSPCSTNPPTTWGSAASTTCSTRSRRPRRPWCSPRMIGPCCARSPIGRGSRSTADIQRAVGTDGAEHASVPIPWTHEHRRTCRSAEEDGRRRGRPARDRRLPHYYGQLEDGVTGTIPEDTIEPYLDPPLLEDVKIDVGEAKQVFDQLAIINLNGGLGTSMGLDQAQSLLPVRDGKSFLDIIVEQVLAARRGPGSRLPLMFMHSFRTRENTLEVLSKYPDLPVGDLPLDFLQNKEPKLRQDDLTPVDWEADPDLEWCPPGHGDIY